MDINGIKAVVRCQEATRLADTTENRAKIRRDVRQIDGEIAAGTFEFQQAGEHNRQGPAAVA